MKRSKFDIYFLLFPIALTVILDEWLKAKALLYFPEETFLTSPHLIDFAVHKNFGLAFDLPFRHELVVLVSIVIGLVLIRVVSKTILTKPHVAFACLMILIGAAGNLFDRLIYGFTVDYLIFFGRSAINFSDLVIVLGVIALLLLTSRKKNIDKTVPIV
ncbi:signal peptidase II [Candidatus Uhrbacteria bacterium]|nr:signal peptidase II [Candidatus Uhrbacteria bacterium]